MDHPPRLPELHIQPGVTLAEAKAFARRLRKLSENRTEHIEVIMLNGLIDLIENDLKPALEFYGSVRNYFSRSSGDRDNGRPANILDDAGVKARIALISMRRPLPRG